MNCSKCNKSLSGISSKVIDNCRYCISCVSDLISTSSTEESTKLTKIKENSITKNNGDNKKTPRMGRVNYTLNVFYVWIILPIFLSSILKDFPDLILMQSRALEDGGIGYYYNSSILWGIMIVLGILFTDSRIQDVGWNRWISFLLWIPVVNILLCVWPGNADDNTFGMKPKPSSLLKKILASIFFCVYVVTSVFVIVFSITPDAETFFNDPKASTLIKSMSDETYHEVTIPKKYFSDYSSDRMIRLLKEFARSDEYKKVKLELDAISSPPNIALDLYTDTIEGQIEQGWVVKFSIKTTQLGFEESYKIVESHGQAFIVFLDRYTK